MVPSFTPLGSRLVRAGLFARLHRTGPEHSSSSACPGPSNETFGDWGNGSRAALRPPDPQLHEVSDNINVSYLPNPRGGPVGPPIPWGQRAGKHKIHSQGVLSRNGPSDPGYCTVGRSLPLLGPYLDVASN